MNHFPQFAFIHWCDGFLRWTILWVVSSLSNWHMKSHWSQLNLGLLCSHIWRVKLEASLNSLPQISHIWGLWHFSWWMFNSFMVFFTMLHSLHLYVRFLVSTFFFNAYVFVLSLPLVVALCLSQHFLACRQLCRHGLHQLLMFYFYRIGQSRFVCRSGHSVSVQQ